MAKRGSALETRLEVQHRLYMERGLLWGAHAHPEVRVVNGADVTFSGKGPPDFFGCLPPHGRMFLFDAKETKRPTWPFSLLKDHQARSLGMVESMGGLSFLVIWFRHEKPGMFRLVKWCDIRDTWWAWREKTSKTASIRFDDPALVVMNGADWLESLHRAGDTHDQRPGGARQVGAGSPWGVGV